MVLAVFKLGYLSRVDVYHKLSSAKTECYFPFGTSCVSSSTYAIRTPKTYIAKP